MLDVSVKSKESRNKINLVNVFYQVFTVLLQLLMPRRNSKWTIKLNLSPALWSNQFEICKALLVFYCYQQRPFALSRQLTASGLLAINNQNRVKISRLEVDFLLRRGHLLAGEIYVSIIFASSETNSYGKSVISFVVITEWEWRTLRTR